MFTVPAGPIVTCRQFERNRTEQRMLKGNAMTISKNTICLWYEKDAEAAARFYAETFPNSSVGAVTRAPSDLVPARTLLVGRHIRVGPRQRPLVKGHLPATVCQLPN